MSYDEMHRGTGLRSTIINDSGQTGTSLSFFPQCMYNQHSFLMFILFGDFVYTYKHTYEHIRQHHLSLHPHRHTLCIITVPV